MVHTPDLELPCYNGGLAEQRSEHRLCALLFSGNTQDVIEVSMAGGVNAYNMRI